MSPKLKLIIAAIAAFVLIIVIFIIYTSANRNTAPMATPPPNSSPSPLPKPQGTAPNGESITGSRSSGQNSSGPQQTKPQEQKSKAPFSLKFLEVAQSSQGISVRAEAINTTTGTCNVVISREAYPSVKGTGDIMYDNPPDIPSRKPICAFLIPEEKFLNTGLWTVKLTATVGDLESEPIERELEIIR